MSLPSSAPELPASLPALIERAAARLSGAKTAAEVLDARDMAAAAYDAARRAARFARAKGAHDELIAKVHRAQADALEIEAAAKRRLADEYDAAQESGEVVGPRGGGDTTVPARNAATSKDVGVSRKDIHEARLIRDAEVAEPGVVKTAALSVADFKKVMMRVSASGDYLDWLLGRNMTDRDRSPCYGRLKNIFVQCLRESGHSNVKLPSPAWSSK